jgi:hypothetical protein
VKKATEFIFFGNMISECKADIEIKMYKHSKLNGKVKRQFVKQMSAGIKLRIYNVISKFTVQ